MFLSICCITYNHESYIAQAIEGFLMQQTNFDFEIIIGEDHSTDKTVDIIKSYQGKYPNKIRLIHSPHNVGMSANFIRTLNASNAKYIALCDGDDYWTNPHKLQKQVDFLEQHSDYFLCAHRTKKYFQETQEYFVEQDELFIENKNRDISINNFLNPFILNMNSVVFRNSFNFSKTPKNGFKDIFLFAIILSKGKGLCLNEIMSVYRIHSKSIWAMKDKLELYKANSQTAYFMKRYFKNRYDSISDFTWDTLRGYLEELYNIKGTKREVIKTFVRLCLCFYNRLTPWQRKQEKSRFIKYLFS